MSLDTQNKSKLQALVDTGFVPGTISLIGSKSHAISHKQPGDWVSVDNELPGQSGDYLVFLRGQNYRVMEYAKGSKSFVPKNMSEAVTHWMMLPASPHHPSTRGN